MTDFISIKNTIINFCKILSNKHNVNLHLQIQTWQINRKSCFLTKYLLDDNDENFIDVSCLIAKGFTNRGH